MSIGTFILSLDCEGKWGVADHLGPLEQRLTDGRLLEAYDALLALLGRFGIATTFAVTELFLLSRDELLALPWEEIAARLPYTRPAIADLREGSRQGWSAPWLVERLGREHELACHGVTHSPWPTLNPEQARYELSLVRRTPRRTFIFPRNALAHLDLLAADGVAGYRLGGATRSRIASLAREFNLWAPAEPSLLPTAEQPAPIPAGYFLNWKAGPRRLVPVATTRARARHILRDAAERGGVAHFWLHPENIATAPATLANVQALLEEVAALRREGRLQVLTQIDHVTHHGSMLTNQTRDMLPCAG